MKESEQYQYIKNNPKLKILFWFLFSISLFLLFYILRFYFWPALFALLVYIILKPIYSRLKKILPNWENFLASMLILIAFILIFLPAIFLLIAVSQEAMRASTLIKSSVKLDNIPYLMGQLPYFNNFLQQFDLTPKDVSARAIGILQQTTNFFVENLTIFIKGSFGLAFDLLLMAVILFFLLKEEEKIEKGFYKLMPFPDELESKIIERTARVIRDVFYGNIVIMVAQGTGVFLLFLFFNIPSAILWGVVGGIFSVIPIISTSVVWLPAVLYFIIVQDYGHAIALGLLALMVAQILENIVKPKILDKKLNIHPLVLFFSLFGGLQAFGIVGLILGPVIITLFLTFMEAYRVIEEFTPAEIKKEKSALSESSQIDKKEK